MERHARTFVAGLAFASVAAVAQQPPQQEGFFRPLPPTDVAPEPGTVESLREALAAERRAREAAERELDRTERELHRVEGENPQAQADVAQQPAPLIASPLDGTAPIVSPLDRFPPPQ